MHDGLDEFTCATVNVYEAELSTFQAVGIIAAFDVYEQDKSAFTVAILFSGDTLDIWNHRLCNF